MAKIKWGAIFVPRKKPMWISAQCQNAYTHDQCVGAIAEACRCQHHFVTVPNSDESE